MKLAGSIRKNDMDKRIVYALAFTLPLLCMIIIYALMKIAPFGDKTLLIMDMDDQYAEFFAYLHRVLLGGDSLQYSFTKGFGGNVVGLFSYYLSSPFSLLAIFFPQSAVPEEILIITLLKVSASGFTFAFFIKNVFKKCDMQTVLFSCIYALTTYSIHYSMCVMWLDSIIWLPVILVGLERILDNKQPWMFVFSYALALISNYYTCYMSTIFIVLYFFFRYVSKDGEKSAKDAFVKLLKVAVSGILGVLLSMFILLPSMYDIVGGKLAYNSYKDSGLLTRGISGILRRLFIGQYDSITNSGSPNIFCGILCGIMTVVYFFNSEIKLRSKITAIVIYAVLFISFSIRVIDMGWHLFQYPNWFPYRYAYVFCFFSVLLSFCGFAKLESCKKRNVFIGMAVYAALILCIWLFDKACLKNVKLAAVSFVFAGVYIAVVAFILFAPKKFKPYACCALVLITCGELTLNGFETLKGLDKEFHYTMKSDYLHQMNKIGTFTDYIKDYDSGFYRADKNFLRTNNDAMNFGYNGLTHYSSTFNNSILDFNKKMGMLQEHIVTRYKGSTEITDCLLGVKYIASEKKVNDKYKSVSQQGIYTIYENPYTLGIGFAADKSALTAPVYKGSAMENQDIFAKSILGRSFTRDVQNVAQTDGGAGREFTADKDGTYYIYTDTKYEGSIMLNINGAEKIGEYDNSLKKLFCLGTFKSGDRVKVKFNNAKYMKNVKISSVDSDEFFKACRNKAENDSFKVSEYGSRWLKGEVVLESDEVLFTTIPYEKGWKAYVDGKRAKVECAQNTFLAVSAGEGRHTIKLKYTAPGLIPGSLISIVTLIALLLYINRERLLKEFMAKRRG